MERHYDLPIVTLVLIVAIVGLVMTLTDDITPALTYQEVIEGRSQACIDRFLIQKDQCKVFKRIEQEGCERIAQSIMDVCEIRAQTPRPVGKEWEQFVCDEHYERQRSACQLSVRSERSDCMSVAKQIHQECLAEIIGEEGGYVPFRFAE